MNDIFSELFYDDPESGKLTDGVFKVYADYAIVSYNYLRKHKSFQ